MLIILEGANGSGKTTLANMFRDVFDAQVLHCTAETPNTLEFFKEIVEASEHINRDIVVDRFCYGQFVYQEESERPILKDEEDIYDSYQALYKLETYMIDYTVKLIYVWSDPYKILDRLKARGEECSIDKILEENNKYEELWKHTLIQPIYFKT